MHESDSFESRILEFPKEFRKDFSQFIDKRYVTVLLTSIAIHISVVIYFLLNPLPGDYAVHSISKIQRRLAKTIKEQEMRLQEERLVKFEFAQAPEAKKESDVDIGAKKAGGAAKPSRKAPKKSAKPEGGKVVGGSKGRAGRRGRVKADIEAEVGSKGILSLLTSSSSSAGGEEVEDILGISDRSQSDLDQALAGLSGMKTEGKPGGGGEGSGKGRTGVRGGRSQGVGDIDSLVSGLGEAKSDVFTRTGDLVAVSESPLIENSGQKGIVGRDQEDVQAVVMKHNKAIQYCYERELERYPNLKGKIVIRFTITPAGTVKNVEIVSSTLNNRRVEQCMVSRLRRWNDFGAIKPSYGDTTIRYVYAFGY
ncbi:AgmX/PglI C-terminal domain-containing protein [candidate division KSB1 bacterium]|nr:AgmX/PglI C-terminal domain-containing protein [candidate division KSB1 bacterium]NIR72727.1 AgmX/PglI C-terminal domain-containing protein [candidate division KSB1 bacterium]NIS26815.1 AgmX/PglI C-terminal domain-containing protein [candidate division KSB1 bacterium]NIT73609.1 AgmX/PglI C-terminal domain-containing protein [candidate division KSB1 bacterium]NIU27482.1 AgmX/PglI C-terminal domain-containing protein [candidate division KSB1 bacterium]